MHADREMKIAIIIFQNVIQANNTYLDIISVIPSVSTIFVYILN